MRVNSSMPLQTAFKRPLTEKVLREQLGRLGETDFVLGEIHNKLVGQAILPVSELNRLASRTGGEDHGGARGSAATATGADIHADAGARRELLANTLRGRSCPINGAELIALCRTMEQTRRRAGIRVRDCLRGFRGHPPLSRGGRVGARVGKGRRSFWRRREFRRPASRDSSS